MEIKVAVSKVGKYAAGICGDSVEVVERPRGGVSVIIVDGQGHGRSAKRMSHMLAAKAAGLVEDGARDGAVMRVINDHLYAFRDGQVSATATILTADLDHDCLIVSRNSNTPVIIGDGDGAHCFDSPVEPIGVRRLIKPAINHFRLQAGAVLIGFTDGVTHAGRYLAKQRFDFQWVYKKLREAYPVQELADSILAYAIGLEEGKPKDDMAVAVLGIAEGADTLGIRKLSVSYPF